MQKRRGARRPPLGQRRDAEAPRVTETGVSATAVDCVCAIGGSSLVPPPAPVLVAKLGEPRLDGGEAMTSVAWDLAARAPEIFGAA